MTAKAECISDHLRLLQNDLSDVLETTGQIHLGRVAASRLVLTVGLIATYARNLENAWSQAEWNRRAFEDKVKLLSSMNSVTADVLRLMRPDTEDGGNVVQFRPKPTQPPAPSTPTGGDAA